MKLLFRGAPSPNVRAFATLARTAGVEVELIAAQDGRELLHRLEVIVRSRDRSVLLDARSLQDALTPQDAQELDSILLASDLRVLVLVDAVAAAADRFLDVITRGAVNGIVDVHAPAHVVFPATARSAAAELSSHRYQRRPARALGQRVASALAECLMSVDAMPALTRTRVGGSSVFVWSTEAVFDAFRPLAQEREFEECVDEYVPALIFLRLAEGDRCWRNPQARAGLVIDDPLLRKSYGFIDFRQLLQSARTHDYHVTLAIIPWNFWRMGRRDGALFREYADCFSTCAHGCDHTKNEFGSADYENLLGRTIVAAQRMTRLDASTGTCSDPVMVCPQEQYSAEALRAFADTRLFVGVVNTRCIPRNLAHPAVCGADLLLPAQDACFGFPVFKRHYWKGGMAPFAMNLFLGKPALLVEHHEFFRGGAQRIEAFARELRALRPDIRWTSVHDTAVTTHLQRAAGDTLDVRFFTDTFRFDAGSPGYRQYRFSRRVPDGVAVEGVGVNGVDVAFERRDGFIHFAAAADRPRFEIRLKGGTTTSPARYPRGAKYHGGVALRRALSEFRDNVVARNDAALRAGRSLMRRLGQTTE